MGVARLPARATLVARRFQSIEDQPAAFFASRMNLSIREDVHKLGQNMGQDIWVAPYSNKEIEGQFNEEVQILCLKKVRDAARFIGVLDGTYGSPWEETNLSILELELITAVLANKPIYIFLLEPFTVDPRLAPLLEIIRESYPEARLEIAKSPAHIKDEIQRLIEGSRKKDFWQRDSGYFLQYQAKSRSQLFNKKANDLDVRFLNGTFAPVPAQPVDKDLITRLIEKADNESVIPYKLANLWSAFRNLGSVPYTSSRYKEFLSLWGAVLSKWGAAAAWYGIHGHAFIGCLAAINSLLEIKRNNQDNTEIVNSINISHGALASEYFSIARMAKSWRYKRALFNKALANVNYAFTESSDDLSDLYDLRGNILIFLEHFWAAVKDYETALQLRIDANDTEGRIGEIKVDLGFAYFLTGHKKKAQRFLEDGIEGLKKSDRPTFTVKAMKKLILFYKRTLQLKRAKAMLDEAYDYAEQFEMNDQLRQLDSLAGKRYIKSRK